MVAYVDSNHPNVRFQSIVWLWLLNDAVGFGVGCCCYVRVGFNSLVAFVIVGFDNGVVGMWVVLGFNSRLWF